MEKVQVPEVKVPGLILKWPGLTLRLQEAQIPGLTLRIEEVQVPKLTLRINEVQVPGRKMEEVQQEYS